MICVRGDASLSFSVGLAGLAQMTYVESLTSKNHKGDMFSESDASESTSPISTLFGHSRQ